MEALGRALRIYGSRDHYGEPGWSPEGQPLVAKDVGSPGDRLSVYFGSVPSEIQRDVSDVISLANAMLDGLFRGETVGSAADILETRREELRVDEFPFYVTLVLDREVALPDALFSTARPNPSDSAILERRDEELRAAAPDIFDLVAAELSPTLGARFFSHKVLPRQADRYLFKAVGHRVPVFYPRLTSSARASVGRAASTFPLRELQARVELLAGRERSEIEWSIRATRWYALALTTEDTWRRFQALSFTLELLANKLSSRSTKTVLADLAAHHEAEGIDENVLAQLVGTSARMTLTAKFAVAAIALAPERSAADVATFARVKDARDKLSHGQWIEPSTLPIGDAEELAGRYLQLALTRPASP
jgi:hypothetical protein